jgi:hypothetical protein
LIPASYGERGPPLLLNWMGVRRATGTAIVTPHHLMPLDEPKANDEHLALLKQGVAAWGRVA